MNTPVEVNAHYWNGEPKIKPQSGVHTNTPIVVELFSGCGGTSMGFKMANYNIALGCDIHIPSIETFQHNHPTSATIMGDIKKISVTQIRELVGGQSIDVLVAGVPCQGFSINNRKRHTEDDRNFLYQEFIRFATELNPKCVIIENVSGMLSSGDMVNTIENELSQATGMVVKSQLLYAPDYGVPQKRRRLFFIGIRGHEFDFTRIRTTHGVGTRHKYVTVFDAIGDLPHLENNETKVQYTKPPFTVFQKWARQDSTTLTNHRAPNHPTSTIQKIKNTPLGQPLYPKYKQRIRLSWDGMSPTQVSGGIRPQFQLAHPEDNRGLSIRERCRIQSFPDHFEVKGGIVQSRVQTGNAVPPLMAFAIAKAVKSYLQYKI
tara:strand:- start:3120 stop:4244 length:1125 start_codon:yes stop_codon:yes gene_type:complete